MRIATLIGTTGLLLTTTALAQDVTYDFARATDFTAFETYAWARANGNPVTRADPPADRPRSRRSARVQGTPAG